MRQGLVLAAGSHDALSRIDHFRFTDAIPRERLWWLVVEKGTNDLCRDDPGHEVDVIVESTVRALTEIWTGDSVPATEISAGRLKVSGAGRSGEKLWTWIGTSMFATSRTGLGSAGAIPVL